MKIVEDAHLAFCDPLSLLYILIVLDLQLGCAVVFYVKFYMRI